MFQSLSAVKQDALISLIEKYRQDPREQKVDLGVGVYQDEQGSTPVMRAVKQAETQLLEEELTKSYQGMAGDPVFNERITELVLGKPLADSEVYRTRCIQTPGGSGALRIAAEVILAASPQSNVWVSRPTWVNHIPLIGGTGLTMREYPYYDSRHRQVDFSAMMDALSKIPAGDVVVLHGCCHNPSGADLSREQWQTLAELAQQKGFIPLVDIAYQGLGDGLDDDAYGVRLMAEKLPELIVAVSCSKNFGLYRERTGAAIFLSENGEEADTVAGHAKSTARRLYSMPPAHGAAVVSIILGSQQLHTLWQKELNEMKERIIAMRQLLVQKLAVSSSGRDYSFIEKQKGMFSFLGLSPENVESLRETSAIYMADSSRINLAGINSGNIDHLVEAINLV